jgi:hypothetical protein
MFFKALLERQQDRLRRRINWNTWILIFAPAILVVLILFIELHLRRASLHSGFVEMIMMHQG